MLVGGLLGGVGPALGALTLGLGLLAAQAARLAWGIRRRVVRPGDAAVHGVLMVVEKWANLAGQIQYRRDRSRGRGARLIEYKQAAEPLSVPAPALVEPR